MSLYLKVSLALVVFVSYLIVSTQMLGIVLLFFFPRSIKRRFHTWLERVWVEGIGALTYPTKLLISGDTPNPNEPAIFIANHQVDADWWFMWVLTKVYGKHGHLKIILKDTLKWIPILGLGMQNFDFIFLHRDFKKDAPMLDHKVKGFLQDNFPFWILLFPEGTTVHQEAIAKSQEFATKEKRPMLSKTILPRVNGFTTVLNAMPDTVKVYDCTMVYSAYTGEIPDWNDGYSRKKDKEVPNIQKLFSGLRTPPTYLHVKEYTAGDIKKEGIQKWLDERWVQKDAVLAHYAATKHMPEDVVGKQQTEKVDSGSLVGASMLVSYQVVLLTAIAVGWYLW